MEETSNDTYAHHTRQFSDLLHIVIFLSAIAPHHFNRADGPRINYYIWLMKTYGISSGVHTNHQQSPRSPQFHTTVPEPRPRLVCNEAICVVTALDPSDGI